MPISETGFCGWEVRTVVRVHGYVMTVFMVFVVFLIAVGLDAIDKDPPDHLKNNGNIPVWMLLVVFLVLGIITAVSAMLLVVGTYTAKKALLVPYMVITVFNIFTSVSVLVYLVAAPVVILKKFVFGMSVALSVYCYFWLHVRSYYQQLSEKEKRELTLPSHKATSISADLRASGR